ncbi:cytosolic endo-beta-N-acetylglucosaminidase [Parasteatoda tepidariorum]|uniref:cytosolic endo-beta-N-acetylglucosaminidase n=1 Tax=Parasteatoda tepidariorum TaxID=114398 RepID=UPI0039BC95EC
MSIAKRQKTDNNVVDGIISFKCGLDECLPIYSLENLKNWKPLVKNHRTFPLLEREPIKNHPKTLVCHDMKGGYLEDRHINGSNTEENYYFLHWTGIDIFVYFSHHLVTIPPCGWISAAHKNGVKILGTFITEWDDGIKVCEALLENEDAVEQLSAQLVKIANYFNFDGWLINIENKLQSCQISHLELFLKTLTKKMHLSQEGSLIIWYDSVLKTGDLKWQNALNENNRMFFDCCDGIFLNYNWTKDTLQKSVEMAGERKTDVFVGADVFGRGCPGGGGFSTDVAASAARKFGLSMAIFAPGWIYECLEVKDFKENQFRFWNLLQKFCPVRKVKSLPYYSSFCPGFGKKLFKNGKVLSGTPWFNVSLQQPQPIYFSDYCPKDTSISLYEEDSFHGGGCICLIMNAERKEIVSIFKILECSFIIDDSIVVSYTFKTQSPNVEVSFIFSISNLEGKYKLYLGNEKGDHSNSSSCLLPASCDEISESQYKIAANPENIEGWVKRVFVLKLCRFNNHTVEDISVQISAPMNEKHLVLLGELEILPFNPKIDFHYRDLVYKCNEDNTITAQCTLYWSYHPSIYCSDLFLLSVEKRVHIGRTSQFHYNLEFSLTGATDLEVLLSLQNKGNDSIPDVSVKIPLRPSFMS